jgi:hypothetical protein
MEHANEVVKQTEVVNLTSPQAVVKFSNDLKKIIVDNKLYTPVKGKNFVNVEGWQIAGAFVGITPIVTSVENLSEGDNYKYRAEVKLVQYGSDTPIGYGVAICTNKEANKRNFDEYAVCSMAQTRAISKAYRLAIGYLMKLAGYEATPAEEMQETMYEEDSVEEVSGDDEPYKEAEIVTAIKSIQSAKTMAELTKAWVVCGKLHHEQRIVDAKDKRKKELSSEGSKD